MYDTPDSKHYKWYLFDSCLSKDIEIETFVKHQKV